MGLGTWGSEHGARNMGLLTPAVALLHRLLHCCTVALAVAPAVALADARSVAPEISLADALTVRVM